MANELLKDSPQARGWTEERRQKHRAAIARWAPWKKSTGPKTQLGKERSSQNALKHGFHGRMGREFHRLLAQQKRLVRAMIMEHATMFEKSDGRQQMRSDNESFIAMRLPRHYYASLKTPYPTGRHEKPALRAGCF